MAKTASSAVLVTTVVLASALWLGSRPWTRADLSTVEIVPSPGFRTSSIRGNRIEFVVQNTNGVQELRQVHVECDLRLKNGNSAETVRFRLGFSPHIPPRSAMHVRHTLDELKYHVNDYQRGSRGLSCRPISGRVSGESRTDPNVAVTDSRCRLLRTGRDDRAQLQVRNETNRTIESLEVRCWSGVRWRRLAGLHRPGAPLAEVLPPGTTEWLQFDPPCLNDYTDASSCRVSKVRSRR